MIFMQLPAMGQTPIVTWTGDTNNTAWSNPNNWQGGALPAASDAALFPSSGSSTVDTNLLTAFTNVLISTSRGVAGIRFAHGNTNTDTSYSIVIQPASTLSVTGTNGFCFLPNVDDSSDPMEVGFYGGGSLRVDNTNADFAMLKGNSTMPGSVLDVGGLSSFFLNVNRIGFGDNTLYDHFANGIYSLGTSAPDRYVANVKLARTNIIRAVYVDPENYNNPTNRNYSLTFNKMVNDGVSSSVRPVFLFGITNAFLMDGICFGGAGVKSSDDTDITFNTDTNVIPEGVMPVAYFRGADGTNRMSVFTVSDDSGPGPSNSSTKATVNFAGGYVDAMVDRLYVGRDRQESADNSGAEATLTMSNGVFNVNTAYISSQELSNNIAAVEAGQDGSGEVSGELNVIGDARFIVNGTMYLGYTTADPGDIRDAESGLGRLSINGGTVMANTIQAGGITKVCQNIEISMSHGGTLIVTNQIAETNKSISSFSMSDSTLVLQVDGNRTEPYVYVDSLVTGGSGNTLKIDSLANVTSFPATIPIIKYQSASPNFSVELPAGYYGYVANDTANQMIDVVINDAPPSSLVWNGSPATDWNDTSPNWVGGAVFANGDTVQFDDTAAVPTVNVSEAVYVGGNGVLITNNSKSYIFSGNGTIAGTSPMNKWGTNQATIDVASQLPLIIHEGSISGSGALGATTVSSNTFLSFSGSINRVTSSGTVSLLAGSIVDNGVDVKAGNFSLSGTVNNGANVNSGAAMTVNPGGLINTLSPNTYTVDSGASLQLDGTWQNGPVAGPSGTYRIDVFGTLSGVGGVLAGKQDNQPTPPTTEICRLNIGAGGVLSPGDTPGQITIFTNTGRFDFVSGSKIIMDVDMDSADGSNPFSGSVNAAGAKNSDVIYADRWSTMLGTLEITNIGTQPFHVGTVFKLFKKQYDTFDFPGYQNVPLNDGELPVMDPPSPGLGMLWDLSSFRTNGVIRITATATNPPVLATQIFDGTNIVFSWPADHTGWQLQTQVNPLDVGLSTNWTVIQGSTVTNQITVTNWIDTKKIQAVFYRLAHPSTQY